MNLRPNYTLEPWQTKAVAAWAASRHPERGTHHGILHVYTGAGKSVLAAAAMVEGARVRPGTKFAVVVPTEALAAQWVQVLPKMTTLPSSRVGQVGGGLSAGFDSHDVVVYVLDSARRVENGRSRLARDAAGHTIMLVVDECHKAGSRERQKIFDVATWARLGLSATPGREDADNMDVFGRPLGVESQPHGRALGPVCFKRDFQDGVREGCLPRFEFHHHAVELTEAEREEYENVYERAVNNRWNALKECGGEPRMYQSYISGRLGCPSEVRAAAGALQQAFFSRKQFLYTASERLRVAGLVLEDAFAQDEPVRGALIFNERVGDAGEDDKTGAFGAERLAAALRAAADEGMFPFGPRAVAVEHSGLARADRLAAIEGLRTGEVSILVSVRALQEGLDVPEVGLGLSVASTASGRQRIQTMGRILRPPRDPRTGRRLDPNEHPVKQLHFFFVRNTPDEALYRKEGWGDFFTAGNNLWFEWKAGADEGELMQALEPPLSERQAWARVQAGPFPVAWAGPQRGITLSWRSTGVAVTGTDSPVVNKAEVEGFLRTAGPKGVPYGRVMSTPELGVALTWGPPDGEGRRSVLAWGRVRVEVVVAENAPLPAGADTPAIRPPSAEGALEQDAPVERVRPPVRAADVEAELEAEVGGAWYQLVQQACIAWVNEDDVTFDAATSLLDRRRGRSHLGRALLSALQNPPDAVPVEWGAAVPMPDAFRADPFRMGHAAKVVVGASAIVAGRNDVVRKVATEFERLAQGRDSMLGLANALRILAGEERQVLAIEKEE